MILEPWAMNPYSVPPLLTALLALALGFFVLAHNPRSLLNRTFSLWCFLTAYWQASWTVLFNVDDVAAAELLARLGYSGIIFIPIVFFHFVVEFSKCEDERRLCHLFYALGAVFLITIWAGDALVQGVYRYYWGFYPKVGKLHPLYLAFLCLMLFIGLYLLLDYRRKVAGQPVRVNQITYAFVSTVIYSLAAIDFVMNYGIEFYPPGFILTNIHAAIITYAIVHYRLLDIQVVIKRSLVYAVLLLMLLVPCYLLVVWGQTLHFGRVDYLFSFMTLSLFILVGFLFPKLRFQAEAAFERVLFKKRYDYKETLLRSSRDMVSIMDLQRISKKAADTVVDAMGVDKASLFLSDDIKGSFVLTAGVGLDLDQFNGGELPRGDPLLLRLLKRPETLVREELEINSRGHEESQVAARMGQLEAEVTLPLVSNEKLVGILNLGHKEGREMYSHEDFEVLSTLANQAAIAIENARLYENLMQSQSIIRRADRLSSLGMLTASLAHEIRNPLVAIRTFTQLLPQRYQETEFREGFQALALKEVDRICGLVNDLLSFARPATPNVAAENVNEIVESIARLLETEAKEKGVRIQRQLAANLPKIFIDKEQIKQVSMNIILNALQSIEGPGVVEVSSRLFTRDSSEQFVQIAVRDTGRGIPEKDLENIFNPFFTTKKEGSGLGLSISHQIIKEHDGYITVESKVGAGTTFFINLPVRRLRPRGGKARLQVHEEDPGR